LALGAGTLGGGGEVVLVNSDFAGTGGARLGGPEGAGSATHGASHTVRGEGTITGKWINDGLMRAEETSGDSAATLRLTHTIANNGVIRSSATGRLLINNLTLTNGATGELIADEQPVMLEGVNSISGGELEFAGEGYYTQSSGTTVLSGVTIAGQYDLVGIGGGLTGTSAGIVNNGVVTIDNLGVGNMELVFAAAGTLGGTGELVLNRDNPGTRIAGSAQITNGADHTIRGVGRLLAPLVNNGSILAETQEGSVLTVLSTITNNGLLQANDGATLLLRGESSITQNSVTGRIRAADGGTVLLQGTSVAGGKLQTDGTGAIVVPATQTFLNNVINEGSLLGKAGSLIRINGATLTNNGVIDINEAATPGFATLEFDVNATLTGTGEVVLNRTGNNSQVATANANIVVTHAAEHTIRGRGQIVARLINHGRLQGDSAAEPLVIFNTTSGDGVMQDVRIAGIHVAGEVGTTAVVPLEGSYNVANFGRLLMDLAGATPGSGYDQLNSTGTISIGATQTRLEVSLVGGFTPDVGDSFTLLTTTGSITGSFSTVVLPTLPFGLSWQQSQTSTSLSISLAGDIAADFDDDGDVDGDDLEIWQDGYATGTLHEQGNADGDGDVDGRDFLIWQRSYGWGIEPLVALNTAAEAASPVPEPVSLTFLIPAVLVALNSRRHVSICRRAE
jgi:hypothetical protein